MKPFIRLVALSLLASSWSHATPREAGWAAVERPDPLVLGQEIMKDGASRPAPPASSPAREPLSAREAAASLAQAKPPGGIAARSGGGPGLLSAPPVTPGGNEADFITPEIQELARGLRYDPVKIFEYVHNFIHFENYFGSKKGAHLTLLEGSGNDFDQASLLVALLRASGHNPTYEYGPCLFSFYGLADWLGLPTSNLFPQWNDAQFLAEYGLPPTTTDIPRRRQRALILEYFIPRGYFRVEAVPLAGGEYFAIPHVWVKLDGRNISPSFKSLTVVQPSNLTTITGTNRAQLLTDAGGSVGGADWVSGLNYGQLSDRLKSNTQTFLQNVRNNYDHLTPDQLVGTRFIVQESFGSLDDVQIIFPDDVAAADWLPLESWSAIPAVHMSKVQIRAGIKNPTTGVWTSTYFNQTRNLPGLRGRKLSLTYAGNSGRIHLDEELVGSAFPIPAAQATIEVELTVTHNHYSLTASGGNWVVTNPGRNDQSWTATYRKHDDYAYALIYSFSNSDRLSRARQEKLEAYRRQGLDEEDWEVRTELLNIIGLHWLYQTHRVDQLLAGRYNTDPFMFHRFGRVSQEDSFYIDVGLDFTAVMPRSGNFVQRRNYNGLTMMFVSALEHGVLEQMQGQDISAVSTVRMVYLANQASKRIYRAHDSNWSTVEAGLSDYPTDTIDELEEMITGEGAVVLLPESGKITLNQYTGFGYALTTSNFFQMMIGANHGGYNSQPGVVTPAELVEWLRSDPGYTSGSSDLIIPSNPLTCRKTRSAIPWTWPPAHGCPIIPI